MKREDVYISSILKDRPPANRDPLLQEISIYAPFLDRQIPITKPKIVITLGSFAMNYIMKKFGLGDERGPISKIHGRIYDVDARYGMIKMVPLFHPAFALYNRSILKTMEADFKRLNKIKP